MEDCMINPPEDYNYDYGPPCPECGAREEKCDCASRVLFDERKEQIYDVCGGIDLPAQEEVLIALLQACNGKVDQLRSEVQDVCLPAADGLALAWWHLEYAIRELTGKCSMGFEVASTHGPCGCCAEYKRWERKARSVR